jgi:hypothetical protein
LQLIPEAIHLPCDLRDLADWPLGNSPRARRIMGNEALPTPSTNRFLSIFAPSRETLSE